MIDGAVKNFIQDIYFWDLEVVTKAYKKEKGKKKTLNFIRSICY